MHRQEIIAQLVEARLEKGISQAELARMLGTQRSSICRLESGTQNPTLDMVLKVASALGKTVSLSLEDDVKMDTNFYSLRIYDRPLMKFKMEKRGLEGLVAEIVSVNEEYRHLLPLDMACTGEGVIQWLERRVIPKNRAFVDEILKTLGLSHNDTKGIIDVCKGLSLNDSYWIVPEGFDGNFADYNLYQNRFSEILALVAYTGAGQSREAFSSAQTPLHSARQSAGIRSSSLRLLSPHDPPCWAHVGSPELTTGGMLPKAWRFIENDGIYLYKGGSSGAANTGREPYCEYYASQIAETMRLNAVHYDLENWKGITASKCALFTDVDTSYIPIGRLVKTGGLQKCLEYYDALGPEYGEQLRSMLVFDALIYNEDRHFGNFGLLRDNHSGKIKAPAPIFDNGLSLLCYAGREEIADFEKLQDYAATRTNPYRLSFEEVCAAVMGAKQKEQLRRMIGFTFRRHPSINFPEEHLRALEKLLEIRVRKLLAIPTRGKPARHMEDVER